MSEKLCVTKSNGTLVCFTGDQLRFSFFQASRLCKSATRLLRPSLERPLPHR